MVLNMDAMTDRTIYNNRMKSLIDEIYSAPTVAGLASVLLSGERERHAAKDATQDAVALQQDVRMKLRECADVVGRSVPDFLK